MPKLAKEYYYSEYENKYSLPYSSRPNLKIVNNNNKLRYKKTKKKNLFRFAVSLSCLLVFMLGVMPFSLKGLSKNIFNPNPHKSVRIDMRDYVFQKDNYLSNSWFMGLRSFNKALEGKNAQMLPLEESTEIPILKSELLNLAELYPQVKPSIYVWDYETQNYVDINSSKIYSAASIIKIPVLIDLFKSIEAGQLSLEDTMPLTEYYRTEGSGNIQFKAENSTWTIDSLARLMITDSDNSATNMLIAKLGSMTDVNSSIRNWGLKNTQVQTWLPDYQGNNYTTAKDMATMLFNIDSNEKFLTNNSKVKILNYMSHVHNNRLIHAGLGEGASFFHKTGDIGKMLGDAGIVITPTGKKYIVVILANRKHNDIAGKNFIVKASEIIYNYMVK